MTQGVIKDVEINWENSPRSQFFTIRTDPKPDNNMFIFFFVAVNWLIIQVGLFTQLCHWLTNHSYHNNNGLLLTDRFSRLKIVFATTTKGIEFGNINSELYQSWEILTDVT